MSVDDIIDWGATVPAWMGDAYCASLDMDLWFSSSVGEVLQAQRLCRGCPVRQKCLTHAIENNERHGVWGGLSPNQRSRLVNKAKRGGDSAA